MNETYQYNSYPVSKNCEVIPCKYDCGRETVVQQKDNILTYTCHFCYDAEHTGNKLGSIV